MDDRGGPDGPTGDQSQRRCLRAEEEKKDDKDTYILYVILNLGHWNSLT